MTAQIDQEDRSVAASDSKRRASAPMMRGYVATIVGMAGLAVIYLVAVAARPDVVAGMLGDGSRGSAEHVLGSEGGAVVADVRRLQTAVGDLRGKVSELRTQFDKRNEEGRALAVRVSNLDERVATMMTSNLTTASLQPRETDKSEKSEAGPTLEGANVTGRVEEPPVEERPAVDTKPVVEEAPRVAIKNVKTTELRTLPKVETPVRATPINFGPATVTVAQTDQATGSAVRLAVGPSLDSVALELEPADRASRQSARRSGSPISSVAQPHSTLSTRGRTAAHER